jgi:hypothetical protein
VNIGWVIGGMSACTIREGDRTMCDLA